MRRMRVIRLKKGTRRTVFVTLLASFSVIAILIKYGGKDNAGIDRATAGEVELSVQPLEGSFRSEGIDGFLKMKSLLKEEVTTAIAKGDPRAEPFAVYLFPELLPPSNFEKSVAEEQWAPLQARIEANPGTEESRKHFDEMRAQIWIYENPDQKHPALSDTADEVVRLYSTLSGK